MLSLNFICSFVTLSPAGKLSHLLRTFSISDSDRLPVEESAPELLSLDVSYHFLLFQPDHGATCQAYHHLLHLQMCLSGSQRVKVALCPTDLSQMELLILLHT